MGSTPAGGTNFNKEWHQMKVKETIDKAYGSIPKEATPWINLDWIVTPRGVKYYWLKFIRVFTR